MAATFAAAFAKVPEPDLDRVAYSAKPLHRAPEDRALAARFDDLDREWQPRLSRRLAARRRCDFHDAEEAIAKEVLFLIEKQPEIFEAESDRWLGMLFCRGWYRLLNDHAAPAVASTDALVEALGDAALAGADRCVPSSPQTEDDAGTAPLPGPGGEWSRRLLISALRRFSRYYGRPPRVRDCRPENRLPSYGTIRKHFDSFGAALVAAGLVPADLGRRPRRWSTVEAARACRTFYREHGYWPGAGDARRNPGVLPGRSVMLRCFGSTHGGEIRGVAEAILAASERRGN